MRIDQFWRLLNFMQVLIMQFYCQKDFRYSYDMKSMKDFGPRTPGCVQCTIDQGINFLYVQTCDLTKWC